MSDRFPESFSLASILAEQGTPPGSTLSQNDWPKTIRKLISLRKTQECEPRGRAVLLGSLTLLLSARVPLPNKISCFVSTCVFSDNSFLSVRQEPSFEPWKGSPFLQHFLLFLSVLSYPTFIFSPSQLYYYLKVKSGNLPFLPSTFPVLAFSLQFHNLH